MLAATPRHTPHIFCSNEPYMLKRKFRTILRANMRNDPGGVASPTGDHPNIQDRQSVSPTTDADEATIEAHLNTSPKSSRAARMLPAAKREQDTTSTVVRTPPTATWVNRCRHNPLHAMARRGLRYFRVPAWLPHGRNKGPGEA